MNNRIKENLQNLSKEQLIKIIEDYNHLSFMISCTLVDESKLNIESEKAIEKIREHMKEFPDYKFYDKHLSDYVNLQLGKISVDEYREVLLGED